MHGVDGQHRVILRRELRRGQMEAVFAKGPATETALRAWAGNHHWGRKFGGLEHRVKLIPPQYVQPLVKRCRNDRNDAEAISEAAARPSMRAVPVKTVNEQAATIVVKLCRARIITSLAMASFSAIASAVRKPIPWEFVPLQPSSHSGPVQAANPAPVVHLIDVLRRPILRVTAACMPSPVSAHLPMEQSGEQSLEIPGLGPAD